MKFIMKMHYKQQIYVFTVMIHLKKKFKINKLNKILMTLKNMNFKVLKSIKIKIMFLIFCK